MHRAGCRFGVRSVSITRVDVRQLRNLSSVSVEPSPGLNVLVGENGSGKTSFLEAIYLLGHGRSFRGNRLSPLLQYGADQFTLFLRFENGQSIGLTKGSKLRDRVLKYNGELQKGWQDVATALPVQLFNNDSFSLLDGGGRVRRQFLNWGVFHVEHHFLRHWRQQQQALKQRNALLKARDADKSFVQRLAPWTEQFCAHSELVSKYRQEYVGRLIKELEACLPALLPSIAEQLTVEYHPGWDVTRSLLEILDEAFDRERRYGSTQFGPHRADLLLRVEGQAASDVLSRGQQKLLASALKLAQIRIQKEHGAHQLIILIDDLAAELDTNNAARLLDILLAENLQTFATAVTEKDIPEITEAHIATRTRKFHVEHGKIREI